MEEGGYSVPPPPSTPPPLTPAQLNAHPLRSFAALIVHTVHAEKNSPHYLSARSVHCCCRYCSWATFPICLRPHHFSVVDAVVYLQTLVIICVWTKAQRGLLLPITAWISELQGKTLTIHCQRGHGFRSTRNAARGGPDQSTGGELHKSH